MGTRHSYIAANSCSLDDGCPVLDGDYDLSECTGGPSCRHQGIAPSLQPQIYCSCKARLLNETGWQVSNGKLELTYYDLLYRYSEHNITKVARWPIVGLRGYGYCKHLFAFEAGRRCAVSGVFIFKCKGSRFLHTLLSEHVNTLARVIPTSATTCTYKPNMDRETWKPSIVSETVPSLETPMLLETVTETLAQQRQTRTSPHTVAHSDRTRQRRRRLSDDYIYLSRTLPLSSLLLNHHHTPPLPQPPVSSASTSPSAGGFYLVAVPTVSSAHSYENQRALVV
ncbi:Fibroblast growth factor receptor substrate [Echinococcus granulosus]|uniref:Fibroblast growth factor receptor substrate n=1 Tax=Echinococcus granulosus TaxID=6210 RepID=W6UNK4_ECHGR|nr:Fibroblast growth factor receptor substrate [Echinococcus granulosus]EUB62798.1 Fibroblast growth factor receptor substrate [Echinococcus granulosus]